MTTMTRRMTGLLAVIALLFVAPASHHALRAAEDWFNPVAEVAHCASGRDFGDLVSAYHTGEIEEWGHEEFCEACELVNSSTRRTCDREWGMLAIEEMFEHWGGFCDGIMFDRDCGCTPWGCTPL